MTATEDIEITVHIDSDEITVSTANRHTKEELSYAKGNALLTRVAMI